MGRKGFGSPAPAGLGPDSFAAPSPYDLGKFLPPAPLLGLLSLWGVGHDHTGSPFRLSQSVTGSGKYNRPKHRKCF